MFQRHAGLMLASLVLAPVAVDRAEAAVKIKISYAFVYDRIRPEPQKNIAVTSRMEIALSKSGKVDEKIIRTAGPFADSFKNGTKLGDGQWDVISENQLRRTFDQLQSILVLTVTTKGDSCKLDVDWKLKPDFTEYQFRRITDGTIAFFTEPKIQGTTCAIE